MEAEGNILEVLPPELWMICGWVGPRDILSSATVCKKWNELTLKHDPLWQSFCEQFYSHSIPPESSSFTSWLAYYKEQALSSSVVEWYCITTTTNTIWDRLFIFIFIFFKYFEETVAITKFLI